MPGIGGYVISNSNGTTTVTSVTIDPSTPTAGSPPVVGDQMVAVVMVNAASGNTITPPAGWTDLQPGWFVYGTLGVKAFHRTRQPGDTTAVFTISGSTRHLNAAMMWLNAAGVPDVVGVPKGRVDAPAETVTCTAPALTTLAAGAKVLSLAFERTAATEADVTVVGADKWFLSPQVGANLISTLTVAHEDVPILGSTGPTTFTYPNSQPSNGWAYQLSFPPATVPAKTGAGSGGLSFGGATVGTRPVVGQKTGSATGNLQVAGLSAGRRQPRGQAGGQVATTGTASSDTPIDRLIRSAAPFDIAHRCGGANWPEFSGRGITESLARGYRAIELSVIRCATGEYVCSHDWDTTRMTGETHQIWQTPWSVLSTLTSTAANTNDTTQTRTPLLRLTDALALIPNDVVVFLDHKPTSAQLGNTADQASRDALLDYLDTDPANKGRIIWKTFKAGWEGAEVAKARGYRSWGIYYTSEISTAPTRLASFELIGMDWNAAVDPYWNTALATGKPVVAHIVSTPAQRTTGLARGAHGIMNSAPKTMPVISTPTGTASGTVNTSGGGTGKRGTRGASGGGLTLTGNPSGTAPTVGGRAGNAVGHAQFNGGATGRTNRGGTCTANLNTSGSAAGHRHPQGSATTHATFTGACVGQHPSTWADITVLSARARRRRYRAREARQ